MPSRETTSDFTADFGPLNSIGFPLISRGARLRRALGWLGKALESDPPTSRARLLDAVSLRFDLTPLEASWIWARLRRIECSPAARAPVEEGR